MIWEIFIFGAILEIAFLRWYLNWKGPMSQYEVDAFMNSFPDLAISKHTSPEVMRKFLQEDDGKEFCMLNMVTFNDGKVLDPSTGKSVSAKDGTKSYVKQILPTLLKHGCHPVSQSRRVGGHIDSWGTNDKIEFPMLAMVRWRSRRDFAKIISPRRSTKALDTKVSSMKNTINIPTEYNFSLFMRPQFSVAIMILLICCLVQITFFAIFA